MKILALAASVLFLTACSFETPEQAFGDHSAEQLRYLESCSQLTISDTPTYTMAMSNCLGRVRGFVDGHAITMELLGGEYQPMWCVSPEVTDGEILDVVLATVDEVAVASNKSLLLSHTSIVGITIMAVTSKYSCK